MFRPYRALSRNGAVGPNRGGFRTIRGQGEAAYYTLALAVATSDHRLYELGIRALEFGSAHQRADGSFPGSSTQALFRFSVMGIRAYHIAAGSSFAVGHTERLDRIRDRLVAVARSQLAELPAHPEVYEAANQVAWLAYVALVSGELAGDARLLRTGGMLLNKALEMQQPDGRFREHGGADTHYQAVTLMALASTYLHRNSEDACAHESGTPSCMDALRNGLVWLDRQISDAGRIGDNGNTRTANDPRESPEGKRIDPREVALSLLYLSFLDESLRFARQTSASVFSDASRHSE